MIFVSKFIKICWWKGYCILPLIWHNNNCQTYLNIFLTHKCVYFFFGKNTDAPFCIYFVSYVDLFGDKRSVVFFMCWLRLTHFYSELRMKNFGGNTMCPQNRYPLTIINHQLKKVFSVRIFKIQMGHLCIRVFAN